MTRLVCVIQRSIRYRGQAAVRRTFRQFAKIKCQQPLVNTTKYVRHRDIWDLRWLQQRGSSINKQFILSKINDYKISDYPAKLQSTIANIEKIIYSEAFHNELSRFIPLDVQERTLKKDKFKEFLINKTQLLLSELMTLFDGKSKQDEFSI